MCATARFLSALLVLVSALAAGAPAAREQAARGNVLEPYHEYVKVTAAPHDESIRRYLERYPNLGFSQRLRADWIRGLGRSGDWATVVAEGAKLKRTPPDVACWILRARWARGDRGAADVLFAEHWLEPRDLFPGCQDLAELVAQAGGIAPEQAWARARRMVEFGQIPAARRALRYLPAREQPAQKTLDLAFGTPERFLAQKHDASRRAEREATAYAIARIASNEPDRAQRLLEQKHLALDADTRAWVHGQAALVVARRLDPAALEGFTAARKALLSDEHYAWWARLAMRAGRWEDVRDAIQRMTAGSQAEARWRYWLARAQRELGATDGADTLLESAAAEHGFYGRLALESLGGARMPLPAHTPIRRAEIDKVAVEPGIRLAIALWRADLPIEARREWNWAVRDWDDRRIVVAARYAHDLGWWDRTVETSERTRAAHDLVTRYPLAYAKLVRENTRKLGIEDALVYSVMRQESRFMPAAKSVAGASGLMQVMPSTGQMLADLIGWKEFTVDALFEPEHSVRLGSTYLKQLSDDLGHIVLAVAGYNAGPGRALAWRDSRALDGAVYAESIPFDETRDYVKQVMAGKLYYNELIGGKPQSLIARLGTIPPRR